jgi:hypothetical protein
LQGPASKSFFGGKVRGSQNSHTILFTFAYCIEISYFITNLKKRGKYLRFGAKNV